jgi:glutamate synthase domain-containing protein 3
MVALEKMTEEADIQELKTLIENHHRYTGSAVARYIIDHWKKSLNLIHKVMPIDYKRALKELAAEQLVKAYHRLWLVFLRPVQAILPLCHPFQPPIF